MSSQSHVSHCRVLPLGEFTNTIPEPHATLHGAVTWRNQCHDRATMQGVRILSAILKTVFRHILFYFCFYCSLGFDERRLSYRFRYTWFVGLSVCRQNAKTRFSQKLSNLELWSLLTTYRKSHMGFSNKPLLDPKIQDGWDPPSWKSTWRHFLCWGWSNLDNISQTGEGWHVDCGDMVKIETRCIIPIWRTFAPIPWHIIPEPPATLQGAATWRIQCRDTRACVTLQSAATGRIQQHVIPTTYHTAGCCHLVNSLSWFQSHVPHCRV